MEYYIGQIFTENFETGEFYPIGAVNWCNEIIDGQSRAQILEIDPIEQEGKSLRRFKICENSAPTKEDISKMREMAYTVEVDPITAHIQRLRDKEQTEEVVAEIAELIAERDVKVEEIKARFPYPTDPIIEKIA